MGDLKFSSVLRGFVSEINEKTFFLTFSKKSKIFIFFKFSSVCTQQGSTNEKKKIFFFFREHFHFFYIFHVWVISNYRPFCSTRLHF